MPTSLNKLSLHSTLLHAQLCVWMFKYRPSPTPPLHLTPPQHPHHSSTLQIWPVFNKHLSMRTSTWSDIFPLHACCPFPLLPAGGDSPMLVPLVACSPGSLLVLSGNEDISDNETLHSDNSTTNPAATEQQPSPPNPQPPPEEQPPKPKLEGVLVNHNEPRSSSRIGLRVHFNLPEDDKDTEASSGCGMANTSQTRPDSFPERFNGQEARISEPSSPVKEPPPVLAKPKL